MRGSLATSAIGLHLALVVSRNTTRGGLATPAMQPSSSRRPALPRAQPVHNASSALAPLRVVVLHAAPPPPPGRRASSSAGPVRPHPGTFIPHTPPSPMSRGLFAGLPRFRRTGPIAWPPLHGLLTSRPGRRSPRAEPSTSITLPLPRFLLSFPKPDATRYPRPAPCSDATCSSKGPGTSLVLYGHSDRRRALPLPSSPHGSGGHGQRHKPRRLAPPHPNANPTPGYEILATLGGGIDPAGEAAATAPDGGSSTVATRSGLAVCRLLTAPSSSPGGHGRQGMRRSQGTRRRRGRFATAILASRADFQRLAWVAAQPWEGGGRGSGTAGCVRPCLDGGRDIRRPVLSFQPYL
ncbi:hypothetical protein SETIT_7G230200v2 [Setaria italica]|uniref:Uncharacterized protein n=1 Tax=Setaria italica TaxID=4555 RepID=A0A368RYY8_SETIT|nr:hypothetical protein SETIT_7G230200v2 [Setaria italica]